MRRAATPSFIAEFPLLTTAADEMVLGIRLGHMRQSRDWQRARRMPKYKGRDGKGNPMPNPERRDLFRSVVAWFEFDAASLQKWAQNCRDACWIGPRPWLPRCRSTTPP